MSWEKVVGKDDDRISMTRGGGYQTSDVRQGETDGFDS